MLLFNEYQEVSASGTVDVNTSTVTIQPSLSLKEKSLYNISIHLMLLFNSVMAYIVDTTAVFQYI